MLRMFYFSGTGNAHCTLRFRAIERLILLTSLTHFAFWRRYRPPGVFASTVKGHGHANRDPM